LNSRPAHIIRTQEHAMTASQAPRVRLGRSNLFVSPICHGTWQLSPRFWGEQPEETMLKAMRRAFEVGVNFFDTADAYGDGAAEVIVGKALKSLPRDQIVLATKVFWQWYPDGHRHGNLSRDHIVRACEASLKRLGMDYIDLYQCHSYDHMADPAEIADTLDLLQAQGKIRAYGTSNWTVEQMRTGNTFGTFSTCQPSYSLLNTGIEADILPYCKASNTGVLIYSSLHKGLLAGKYLGHETFTDFRKDSGDFKGERFKTICQRVQSLKPMAEKYGLNLVQLILVTTLMHPSITCAIVGIKDSAMIEEAAGAMGKTISREDYYAIRATLNV